jgi:hypothetical protein
MQCSEKIKFVTFNFTMIIEIPRLQEIEPGRWFSTDYSVMQKKEIRELIEHEVWVTAQRRQIPVNVMSTSHIQNCIRCWEGKGRTRIPKTYLGGKEKWLKIFHNELAKRQ